VASPPIAALEAQNALEFILAGKAVVTFVSQKTDKRFTYQIEAARGTDDLYFVRALSGPSNTSDYTYLGTIRKAGARASYYVGAKSRFSKDAPVQRAFSWVFRQLAQQNHDKLAGVEILHAGYCGRCGRLLTTEQSIKTGIGPVCLTKMGGSR
jgi:hypothetical protein